MYGEMKVAFFIYLWYPKTRVRTKVLVKVVLMGKEGRVLRADTFLFNAGNRVCI